MQFEKPIVFFDLETTGLDLPAARIVQLALARWDGTEDQPPAHSWLVNPGIPIPPDSTAIHGITDDMVRDQPRFADIAEIVFGHFAGADLGGYNIIRFDVPVLAEEFARAGFTFPVSGTRIVDAYQIYSVKEPRTLAGALKYFTGRTLQGAHSADADAIASLDIFKAQLNAYADLPTSMDELHSLCHPVKFVDHARKFTKNDEGIILFNFGKHRGKPALEHRDYLSWMLESDFPAQTKAVIQELLK
jgi:DNA polymerase-3 subunit epsilon